MVDSESLEFLNFAEKLKEMVRDFHISGIRKKYLKCSSLIEFKRGYLNGLKCGKNFNVAIMNINKSTFLQNSKKIMHGFKASILVLKMRGCYLDTQKFLVNFHSQPSDVSDYSV